MCIDIVHYMHREFAWIMMFINLLVRIFFFMLETIERIKWRTTQNVMHQIYQKQKITSILMSFASYLWPLAIFKYEISHIINIWQNFWNNRKCYWLVLQCKLDSLVAIFHTLTGIFLPSCWLCKRSDTMDTLHE